jgi:RNA polymerase sigma-70 factor (ECF subfamily)
MNIEEIFLDYNDYIYKFIYGMVQNRAEAEDLLQDTFIKVIKAQKNKEEIQNWKNYLLTVARNTVYDHWRKRKNKISLDNLFNLRTKEKDIDLQLDIEKGIKKLSPKLKEVIVLREINQLEYSEIAEILGIEKGTVKSRLNRAREELKNFLEGNK